MPEDHEFQKEQLEEALPSALQGHNLPVDEEYVLKDRANNGENPPGFLELVYGVLFEPKGAMARVAARPPLGIAALVVTILSLVGAVIFYITLNQVLSDNYSTYGQGWFFPATAFLPVAAIFSLVFGFIKWFFYSAILHLAADLLGGRGSARAVFAVVGFSGLPAVFLMPIQLLAVLFFPGSSAIEILLILAAFAMMAWTLALAVIGIKAAHGLSTGRALLSALTPVLSILAVVLVALVSLAALLATVPAKILPGYF